jgi:hypothetical protein
MYVCIRHLYQMGGARGPVSEGWQASAIRRDGLTHTLEELDVVVPEIGVGDTHNHVLGEPCVGLLNSIEALKGAAVAEVRVPLASLKSSEESEHLLQHTHTLVSLSQGQLYRVADRPNRTNGRRRSPTQGEGSRQRVGKTHASGSAKKFLGWDNSTFRVSAASLPR